jgi:cytoskeleton protein RodZ
MSSEQTTLGAEVGATPAPEAASAEAPPVDGPGARLRSAREARHLGVQQVTDLLHIEPRLLAAMEAEDFAAFDAPVYARGFLRKYATFLEVPADEILAAYERLHSGPGTPTLIPPATAEEPRRDWSALKLPLAIAGALLLVGGSYWWWLSRDSSAAAEPERATVVMPATAASEPATPAQAPLSTASDAAATTDGQEAAATIGAAAATAGPASAPASASLAAAAVPAGATAPPSVLPSGAALEIDFLGDCWVEVTGPNGARLMYDLGRAGESRALPGPGPWRVFLGSADAARLRVAGRPVPVPAANRSGVMARLVVGPDGTVQ